MRALSFHTTLLAVLLGSSAMVAHAETDAFFADLDKTDNKPAVAASKTVHANAAAVAAPIEAKTGLDMTPTHSLGDKQGAPEKGAVDGADGKTAIVVPSKMSPDKTAFDKKAQKRKTGDGVDPEPDVAITPPSAPSADPLDALSKPLDSTTSKGADKSVDPGSQAIPDKQDAVKPGLPAAPAIAVQPAQKAATQAPLTQDPLTPAESAIKAALDKREALEIRGAGAGERRKERDAIAFFYAARGFTPLWSAASQPIASVKPVLARLARAADDALSLSSIPTEFKSEGTTEVVAENDIALTEAVVAYARQATGSRVMPSTISPLIGSKPTLADPSEVLETIAAAGAQAGDTLQAMNPSEPRYIALRDKLIETRGIPVADAGSDAFPAGPTLKRGMHDPRVARLRARLGLDAAIDPASDDLDYDAQVAEAVAGFQRTNGLPPSGVLNKKTVEALSGRASRPAKLEGMLIANMEMWRWMPRDLGADRIEVNIPDFQVTVFHDNALVSRNRVVVGKMDTPTPLFSNTMKYLIVNPYWNVPQSIIKNEMLPKGGGSLSYLDGRGYSVSSHNGFPVVKQLPGDKNALGRIKFLFPNDYSVYLHDTPSKALFSSTKRAFSHGCVRVDKPFAFAASVLNDAPADAQKASSQPVWSQERLEDMIGDKERYVNLPAPLPIHIEYFTASVDAEGGAVTLRDDVYGYAHAVSAALGHESAPLLVAGRTKPKPVIAERVRRAPVPTATAEAAPVASRSFWDVFDPR